MSHLSVIYLYNYISCLYMSYTYCSLISINISNITYILKLFTRTILLLVSSYQLSTLYHATMHLFLPTYQSTNKYVTVVETSKEIKWMTNILTEFESFLSYVLTLFIDNKSKIKVTKNLEYHRHIKC